MKASMFSTAMALFLAAIAPAQASPLLAQNGPHVTYNTIPFGTSFLPQRYEQVFSGGFFGGPTLIKSLAFSSNTTGIWSGNVTIKLSSTTAAVGALSSDLSSNVTGPETTVLSQVAFTENITSAGTESFGFVFDIADYLFSGTGNLLLDITLSDVVDPGGGFSRSGPGSVYSRAYDGGADGGGLRTLFDVGAATVPEPESLALLGIGMLAAAVGAARRRKSRSA